MRKVATLILAMVVVTWAPCSLLQTVATTLSTSTTRVPEATDHFWEGLVSMAQSMASLLEPSTVTQNVSWTIDRGTSAKYRVVAYGDSIYAGWEGDIWDVAIWSGANVTGDYASNYWGTEVEIIRL